jgi:hypothetical protein
MGLRPTHWDESAFVRFIDSKRVTRDFRRSAALIYEDSKYLDSKYGHSKTPWIDPQPSGKCSGFNRARVRAATR